jgi:hypothetical protein
VHLISLGFVVVALLQQQQDQAIPGERGVDRFDRDRPVDGQRLQRERKRHRPPQRQNGELRWEHCRG